MAALLLQHEHKVCKHRWRDLNALSLVADLIILAKTTGQITMRKEQSA
jgi:hypothetical protein